MKTEFTGYWTFFCNPAKWQIDDFLSTGKVNDSWSITEWQSTEFKPGQLGVIRVGIDSRTKSVLNGKSKLQRGIYGIVQITSYAKESHKYGDEFWLKQNKTESDINTFYVDMRYLKNLLVTPLLLDNIKNDLLIKKDKYLLNGFQAKSMPLDPDTFKRIIQLTGTTLI